MTDRNDTCAARIDDHLKGRAEDLIAIFAKLDAEDDEAYDEIDSLPLAVSVKRTLRIDLSTGGPADWIEVALDDDNNLDGPVVYHFADWYDHAETTIRYDEARQAFERFAEYYAEALRS